MDTKTTDLLGFSHQETKIWQSLQKRSSNITELAGITHFPRTTLYTALSSLKRRGLIKTYHKGKSVIVSPIENRDISDLLNTSALTFNETGNIRVSNKEKDGSGFTVVYGKEVMFKVLERLTQKGVKRLYAIQPAQSLLNTIKHFKPGEFIPINNAIRKNKIIVDAIIREDNVSTYLNFHKDDRTIQKKIVESFLGRMADTTLVKNEYLNNNADLIFTSQSAFLMNWEQEVGIEIKNRDMIDLLKELFELAKGYGKKIDFNEYMREHLRMITGVE
jgi:Sugar-specific transcriptional regulator TrmB